jgi:hypothetical protein
MCQTETTDLSKVHEAIKSRFIEPGFEYWFTDHQHVRSPFTKDIKETTRTRTTTIFLEWVEGLTEEELKTMKEEEFIEMFETILFNEAIKLVEDEDQRLTITYPFMPRIGDIVKHKENGNGKVIDRKEVVTKENKKMLELSISSEETGVVWKTEFELTA